jgi:CubicO group peptidase (beta-lactamase class C family)
MPITAQPGTRFQYCSRCVVLVAYVLERVTGQSWEAYTRTHIFESIGMTTAGFGLSGWRTPPTGHYRIGTKLAQARRR